MDTIRKHLFDDHVSQFWIVSFFCVRFDYMQSFAVFELFTVSRNLCVMRFYVA